MEAVAAVHRTRRRCGPTARLLLLFAALAVLHTWPLATDPGHLSRLDNDDTAFNTWVVAWVAHQLPRDPLALFQAPIFHPERDTLAYSEHMLVPSLMGAPLLWLGASPVLVYNLLVMAGLALSAWSMALVVGRWTGSRAGGIVAGALFGYNALVLVRFPHLQAQHMEFFPIALLAVDRVMTRAWPRDTALLVGAFVLQSLCSNYTMVFLAGALCAAVAVRPDGWLTRARRVWPQLAVAGAVSGVLLLPFLLPYVRVRDEQGLVRSLDEVARYSATWRDYLTTASRLHFDTWSAALGGQTALFPGALALVLAVGAMSARRVRQDRRAHIALAIALLGLLLSFGVHLPGYSWLHAHVPLLQGIRVVARWGVLVTAGVAILAGYGVACLEFLWRTRGWRGWPAVAAALLATVTLEASRAPIGVVPFGGIDAVHDRVAASDARALVVYPLYPGGNFHLNAPYLLWQTRHFIPMVNGYSSFAPQSFHERATRLLAFPDASAITELKAIGVTDVLLDRPPLVSGYGEAAVEGLKQHPALELVLEAGGIVWYRLR